MIALFLLAVLILQQSWGLNWFKRSAKAVTYLTDVGGLKPGAPVWLAGIEIGRVRSVSIVPPEAYSGNALIYRSIEEADREIQELNKKLPASQKMINELQDQHPQPQNGHTDCGSAARNPRTIYQPDRR